MSDRLHAIERWTLGLGAALSLLAFAFGRSAGLSVSVGAALTIVNAFAMRRLGERIWQVFRSDSNRRPLGAIVLFNLKMAAILVAVYFVITYLHVDPIGLVVGISAYPLAAVVVALTWVAPPVSTDAPLGDQHG